MGLIEIDGPKALRLLAETVEAKGADYVYEPKQNEDGTKAYRYYHEEDACPGCIAGYGFLKAGASLETLAVLDRGDSGGDAAIRDLWHGRVLEQAGLKLTFEAYRAFAEAQGWQDQGGTWGESLSEARAAVENC